MDSLPVQSRVASEYLVNVAEDSLLDALVFNDLTEDTTVTTADDKNLLRIGVGVHGQVGDHLLVAVPNISPFCLPYQLLLPV